MKKGSVSAKMSKKMFLSAILVCVGMFGNFGCCALSRQYQIPILIKWKKLFWIEAIQTITFSTCIKMVCSNEKIIFGRVIKQKVNKRKDRTAIDLTMFDYYFLFVLTSSFSTFFFECNQNQQILNNFVIFIVFSCCCAERSLATLNKKTEPL